MDLALADREIVLNLRQRSHGGSGMETLQSAQNLRPSRLSLPYFAQRITFTRIAESGSRGFPGSASDVVRTDSSIPCIDNGSRAAWRHSPVSRYAPIMGAMRRRARVLRDLATPEYREHRGHTGSLKPR